MIILSITRYFGSDISVFSFSSTLDETKINALLNNFKQKQNFV